MTAGTIVYNSKDSLVIDNVFREKETIFSMETNFFYFLHDNNAVYSIPHQPTHFKTALRKDSMTPFHDNNAVFSIPHQPTHFKTVLRKDSMTPF
jgi:hypothetical protein